MKQNIIRLSEGDLQKMVKEAVGRLLREYGDTPEGQRRLGALHARTVIGKGDVDKGNDIYKYSEKGRASKPVSRFHDYANGFNEYMDSHDKETAEFRRKKRGN